MRFRKQILREDTHEDLDHLTLRQYFKWIARKIGRPGSLNESASIWRFRKDLHRRHTKRILVRCDDGVFRLKAVEVAYAANRGRSLELTPALLAHVAGVRPRGILAGVSNLKEYDKVIIKGLSSVDDDWTAPETEDDKPVFSSSNFAANTSNVVWKIPGLTKAIGVFREARRENKRNYDVFGYHLPTVSRGWAAARCSPLRTKKLEYEPINLKGYACHCSPLCTKKYVETRANLLRLRGERLRDIRETVAVYIVLPVPLRLYALGL